MSTPDNPAVSPILIALGHIDVLTYNTQGLISTSAVQSGGKSYLFYSRPNGELAFLRSVITTESSPDTPTVPLYTTGNIIVDENVITANTKSPQISAVAYTRGQQDEVSAFVTLCYSSEQIVTDI